MMIARPGLKPSRSHPTHQACIGNRCDAGQCRPCPLAGLTRRPTWTRGLRGFRAEVHQPPASARRNDHLKLTTDDVVKTIDKASAAVDHANANPTLIVCSFSPALLYPFFSPAISSSQ